MKSKRIEKMKEYIAFHKNVSMEELEAKFLVSVNTIRRDLQVILKDPLFKKIYGGVEYISTGRITPYSEREEKSYEQKSRIAEIASTFIEEGDVIFIDSGTTTSKMSGYFNDIPFTIITNNLLVIMDAVKFRNIKVIALSGFLCRDTMSLGGTSSVDLIRKMNINKAFMACTGFSNENGVSNSSIDEFDIKSEVIERSSEVILLATSDKAGKTALMTYMPFSKIQKLVTDQNLSEEYVSYLNQNQTKLYT
ncbi:DeoR family transcriptional regulator, myo-inositol catabolism operon repressor [Proteiniclasticum ruminis]|uniref:DeoR family transcriptional regulator, myo-inositol catabolism operon repressor n=2 Tax=Proteiniclasticum ruminis TaxID=398199 RepID=A0A1G8JSQ6_9CLOT|nr:DeoR/GlpR family DNA-binding transcription regulator [Proteiniclasticum ruminis]SDI34246.1 DeoR family transcriptional regulator, myo-inositol catabolism operon repressor [Proteiniclasticum ruminis]